MIFWIMAGLGFGYWATEQIGGLLKDIYVSGNMHLEWLNDLYIYCLMNGFFAMLITGLPFYLVGIWCCTMAMRDQRYY